MEDRFSGAARRGVAVRLGLLVLVLGAAGCSIPERLRTPERYTRGVVYVLPGIEGPSVWSRRIALGLDEGGVTSAIEIFDWTTKLPGGFWINLTFLERNLEQARRLADRIVEYRERYPGAPVHLVGHSGGAGVAVLALEALPPGRQIDMALLLAPAISPDYNLVDALRRARDGVVNFYSKRDVGFLRVGTTLLGAVDRKHGSSAGAVGFETPGRLAPADRALYANRLKQVRWDPRLRSKGASGTHMGWASREFARETLAPLIQRNEAARALTTADP